MNQPAVRDIARIVEAAHVVEEVLRAPDTPERVTLPVEIVRDEMRFQAERLRDSVDGVKVDAEREHVMRLIKSYDKGGHLLTAFMDGEQLSYRDRRTTAHFVRLMRRYHEGRIRRRANNYQNKLRRIGAPVVDDSEAE